MGLISSAIKKGEMKSWMLDGECRSILPVRRRKITPVLDFVLDA